MPPSSGTIPRLDELIKPFLLEGRSEWHSLLLLATFAVVAGVALEGWEIFKDVKEELNQNRASKLSTSKPLMVLDEGSPVVAHHRTWIKTVGAIGWALVVLGVGGELAFDSMVADFDNGIRLIDDNLLKDSRLATVNANVGAMLAMEEAAAADSRTLTEIKAEEELANLVRLQGPRWRLLTEDAHGLIRKLSPFAGQRVDVLACGAQSLVSGELRRTHQVLAGPILFDGAKWPINNHADPPMFWVDCSVAINPGILIFISSKAPPRVRDAATVLSKALRSVVPTSIAKTMPLEYPGISFWPEIGKNHPWNLLVGHPELIVVLVGEHPQQ